MIWTDVMQFALYITGSLAAFLLLLHKIPGGWPTVTHAAAAAGGKLTIFDFAFSLTKSYTFWSGLLGGTFLTMASHGTDQTMVQRLLASRNERDSKTALLASGVIIFAQFALFLVLGVMLFVYAQHFALHDTGRRCGQNLSCNSSFTACPLDLQASCSLPSLRCDVECKRLVELAGIIQHHRPRARARRKRSAISRSLAQADAWFGASCWESLVWFTGGQC